MTDAQAVRERLVLPYCNCLAQERGLDPVGTAADVETIVLLEQPLPWTDKLYTDAGPLPRELLALQSLWLERYNAGLPYDQYALLIAPDREYSRPGHRRVLQFRRSAGLSARFERLEYLVPEADAGPLLWALFEAPERLPDFAAHRLSGAENVRDLLVCTHGSVDAACAKFGFPLYRTLREQHADAALRVWRVSHFGGHVFAPTLLDFPTGHLWAYVGAAQAAQLAAREGDVAALWGHYRGWSGFSAGFVQAAERELWQRFGWAWLEVPRAATVLAQDPTPGEPSWAVVRIDFEGPEGRGAWQGRVAVAAHIATEPSTGSAQPYPYPQYVVTEQDFMT